MPSDWNSYYSRCGRCGARYHDSEGGCGCLDDHVECGASGSTRFVEGRPPRFVVVECYVHCDDHDAVEIGDKTFCREHAACDGCGTHNDEAKLIPYMGDIYCPGCSVE